MTYTEASTAHLSKRDVDLARYLLRDAPGVFEHSTRVADRVRTFGAAQVALFHDVLEDSNVDRYILRLVLGAEVMETLETLTRSSSEHYAGYIDRILTSGDPIAVAVKLADLYDHLDLTSTLTPTLRVRYERALGILEPRGKYLLVRKHLRLQPRKTD